MKAFLDGQGQEDGEIEGEGLLRDAGDGQRPEGRDHVVLKTDIDMGTQTFRITGAKVRGSGVLGGGGVKGTASTTYHQTGCLIVRFQ